MERTTDHGSAAAGSVSFWARRRALIFKALVVAILIVWPLLYQSGYAMRVMTTGGLYTLLTVAVVVILGQAGSSRSPIRPSTASAPTPRRSSP